MTRIVSARLVRAVLLLLVVTSTSDAFAQHRRRSGSGSTSSSAGTSATPAADPSATTPAETPTTTPAPDAQSTGARQLFMQGQEAYSRGDYAGAIALWDQALAIDPRPQLHYNLAQAYGRLGRVEEEMAALRHYLDGAPPEDPTVTSARSRLTSLEQRLAQTGIDVTGVYPGARVVVDGQERGTMPMHDGVGVRPGSHSVDVFHEGYDPFHSAVVVPAGERVTVTVVLRRSSAQSSGPRHPMRAPIALYASGGAMIVGGAVFGALALTTGSNSVSGTPDGDRAHRFAIVADATIGAGIALGATGLVLHILRRGDDEEPATPTHASVFPVVGADRVGVAGRF